MSIADVLQRAAEPGRNRLDAPASTIDLAAIWACTPALWLPMVHERPGERAYARLFPEADRGPAANAWVITWAPGTAIELHDHGDAAAAVAVVRGTLTEQFTVRGAAGPLDRRQLPAGSIVSFGEDHLHEIRNTGAFTAVSIHVYSASLDGMTFYDAPLAAAS